MGNRQIRLAIQGLRTQIDRHLEKIDLERARPHPNDDLIRHWEREIEAFTERMERLEARLTARRRRGRTG